MAIPTLSESLQHRIQKCGNHEFVTCVIPHPEGAFQTADVEMEAEGWHRAWSSVTLEGCFIVYQRPVTR